MIVGAVVLAAGKSERMGENKLLLCLNGKTLIENVLDGLAAAGISEQVVVLGYKLEDVLGVIKPRLGRLKIVLNVNYEAGMTSSFQTGLLVLSNVDAAFLVLGDQPIMEPKLLGTMIQMMEKNAEALIACPIHNGKKGHPLLFRKQLFGEIFSLKTTQTIRAIVHAHADQLVTLEAPEWTTIDIDTPQDYARLSGLTKTGNRDPSA
jgi:molybdenum cofactor cytidylyltransferase